MTFFIFLKKKSILFYPCSAPESFINAFLNVVKSIKQIHIHFNQSTNQLFFRVTFNLIRFVDNAIVSRQHHSQLHNHIEQHIINSKDIDQSTDSQTLFEPSATATPSGCNEPARNACFDKRTSCSPMERKYDCVHYWQRQKQKKKTPHWLIKHWGDDNLHLKIWFSLQMHVKHSTIKLIFQF